MNIKMVLYSLTMPEAPVVSETKLVLPPPNSYNRGALESFRNGAAKAESLSTHPDLVVILGGSFAKGLGHFYSDTDWLFITQDTPMPESDAGDLLVGVKIDLEFNKLITSDPRYSGLKKYAVLARVIDKKFERLVDDGKIERYAPEYIKRYLAQPALLQRATKSEYVQPQIPEGRSNFAGSAFWNDIDQDIINDSMANLLSHIKNFDPTREYSRQSFHEAIAVVSAQIGVNAHEVTPGTLLRYQRDIVEAIDQMLEEDPEKYAKFLEVIRLSYQNYTRQPNSRHGKSPKLAEALFRTEKGEPLLDFYKGFPQFPGVEELENYFSAQQQIND